LKDDYEGRWIRRGRVVWPIQSSDLNTLHFFMWGCTQSRVCHGDKLEATYQLQEAIVIRNKLIFVQ
jgi:hypothetical protein